MIIKCDYSAALTSSIASGSGGRRPCPLGLAPAAVEARRARSLLGPMPQEAETLRVCFVFDEMNVIRC